MRQKYLLLCLLSLLFQVGYAQGYESKIGVGDVYKQSDNYLHVGFTVSDMVQKDVQTLKNYAGFMASIGRTFSPYDFYLNDVCRFGIDATWLDFEYTSYKVEFHYPSTIVKEDYGQYDFGVQVGPAFIIEPTYDVHIHTYCRYAPTYSLFSMNGENYGNLVHFLVVGASLSYNVIGIGVEGRWGVCHYSDLYENGVLFTSEKVNHRGVRVYLKFNF